MGVDGVRLENRHYPTLRVLSFMDYFVPVNIKKRIFLRSFFSARNLLLCKRKNHPARWFFEGSATGKFLNRGNWLRGAQSPKLFV